MKQAKDEAQIAIEELDDVLRERLGYRKKEEVAMTVYGKVNPSYCGALFKDMVLKLKNLQHD